MTIKEYLERSKSYAESILFILPLLVFYELGIALSGSEVENAAGVIMKTPLQFFGRNATLIFNVLVAGAFAIAFFAVKAGRRFQFRIFVPMFLESLLYGLLLQPVANLVMGRILSMPLAAPFEQARDIFTRVMLAIGAGVYEELVYRLLLLSVLFYVLRKSFEIREGLAAALSILFASLIFAGMHYIGAFGDALLATSFLFRFLCGLMLSTIFIFRGLGIAVYAHALYDFMYILWPNA